MRKCYTLINNEWCPTRYGRLRMTVAHRLRRIAKRLDIPDDYNPYDWEDVD